MNRLTGIAVTGALMAYGAAAQNSLDVAKLKAEADHKAVLQMKMMGAVKGTTVKGAPYSAEEVNETTQTLADGTRIHRETKTTVYRDSEGRTRRETPDNITITDPVANVTYLLFPKSMTGQKLALAAGNFTFIRTDSQNVGGVPASSSFTVTSDNDGPATITINGTPLDEKLVAEAMAKAKSSGASQSISYERREFTTTVDGGPTVGIAGGVAGGVMGGVIPAPPMHVMARKMAGESLGKQMIEGVNATGTRSVSTIAAGEIGNDRPIQMSAESWYSDELQTTVLSKHSDPRTGDETFRLTNISRAEPAAYLFQAPAGYQINERK